MSINSTTGLISGTPSVVGNYTVPISATNAGGTCTASLTISVLATAPPVFTNGAPGAGTINTAYSFTFTATGSPAPTFSLTSGSLPTGVSLASTGILSGKSTATGIFTGVITAKNGIAPNAVQSFSITINPKSTVPILTDGPPPTTATVGTPYNFTYTASGFPIPTYGLNSGSLPPGLTLAQSGLLSGTPTQTGTYTGTVNAFNGNSPTPIQAFSITVQPANAAPSITNGPPPNLGTVGASYNYAYIATGYPVPTLSVTSGALPPGLTLSSAGVVSGTPTNAGAYNGIVTASNGISPAATQNFSITIQPAANPPLFTDGPPPTTATINASYSFAYTATGSPTPNFSVLSGALPPGLVLSSTGTLSGTPTQAGIYTGVINATNGINPDATQSFSIAVSAVTSPPLFTDGPPPTAASTTAPYNFTFTASGYPIPTFSVTAGALPTGLTLSSTGTISGLPTQTGTFTGTVTASNGSNPNATQNFSIIVQAGIAPLFTDGPPPTTATSGTAFNFTYTASGFPKPTFSNPSGALPSGLSMSSAGVISGKPSKTGVYSGTIMASNGINPSALQSFSITVSRTTSAPPVFTDGPATSSAYLGEVYVFSYIASGAPAPTFALTSGSLPPGLSLSSAGQISGTPTQLGTYSGVVTATNGLSPNATQNLTITVQPQPTLAPYIESSPPFNTVLNAAYNFAYVAEGVPTPTFAVTSGSLPPGLALTSAGLLSGAATQVGTFTGVVTASNSVGTYSQNFSITVSNPAIAPLFTDGPPVKTLALNAAYSFTYTASGAPAPTFYLTSGSFPTGLSLSSAGVLSGTVTQGGSFAGVVTAANGVFPSPTQAFTMIVTQPPTITNGPPPAGNVGTPYSFTYLANGYPAPTFSRSSGSLPKGVTFTSAGVLSGTPTQKGVYTGVITASNGINPAFTQNYSISITATGSSVAKTNAGDTTSAVTASTPVNGVGNQVWIQNAPGDFSADSQTNTTSGESAIVLAGSPSSQVSGAIANPSFEQSSRAFPGWAATTQGNLFGEVAKRYSSVLPSDGSNFAQIFSKSSQAVDAGDTYMLSQSVDLTGISSIKFDAALGLGHFWNELIQLDFLIDGTPVWSQTSKGNYLDQSIDTTRLTGTHTIAFRSAALASFGQISATLGIDNLRAYTGEGYEPSGIVVSMPIQLGPSQTWGILLFAGDVSSAGTGLTVDVLDANGNLLASNVHDGTNLTSIPVVAAVSSIELRAILTTTDPSHTPQLKSWSVSH